MTLRYFEPCMAEIVQFDCYFVICKIDFSLNFVMQIPNIYVSISF